MKIKPLPRAENGKIAQQFKANGMQYHIVSHTAIGIKRWSEFEKMSIALGFGSSFNELYESVQKAMKVINSDGQYAQRRIEATLILNSVLQAIKKSSEQRFNISLMVATLFIVRDGEDMRVWTKEDAEKKIADWNAEGYSEQDFFLLSVNLVRGFRERFSELTERAQTN